MKHFFLQDFYLWILVLRVLGWLLVAAGIYLLSKGTKRLQESFSGTLLLEIPLTQSDGKFHILKAGIYAIWQKGELLRRRPSETIRPHIYEESTGTELPLLGSLSDKSVSNGAEKRIEIFTFKALAGEHNLVVESGLPLSKLDAYMEGIFPLPVNEETHFLQIRETQSGGRLLLSVPLLLLGIVLLAGGLLLTLFVEWMARL